MRDCEGDERLKVPTLFGPVRSMVKKSLKDSGQNPENEANYLIPTHLRNWPGCGQTLANTGQSRPNAGWTLAQDGQSLPRTAPLYANGFVSPSLMPSQHVLLLLDLRVSDFLAASPTSNCRRLNRTFPLFVPETLLLGSPKTFGATITAGKTNVFIIERRRIGIIRSLLAKVRLDSTTVCCFDLLVHGPNRSSIFEPMGSKTRSQG